MKDTHAIFVSEWALDIPPLAAEPDRAAEAEIVGLPRPQTEGGRPLMQILKDRHEALSKVLTPDQMKTYEKQTSKNVKAVKKQMKKSS